MKKSTYGTAIAKAFFPVFIALMPVLAEAQDIFEIKFTAGTTQHRAALVLYGDGTGVMRVRYYSNGQINIVEQTMRVENTTSGYRIAGYSPVYAGTSTRHPSYVADNFYLSQDEYGNYSCVNIDDGGNSAACSVRSISGYYTKQAFLSDFKWKLD